MGSIDQLRLPSAEHDVDSRTRRSVASILNQEWGVKRGSPGGECLPLALERPGSSRFPQQSRRPSHL